MRFSANVLFFKSAQPQAVDFFFSRELITRVLLRLRPDTVGTAPAICYRQLAARSIRCAPVLPVPETPAAQITRSQIVEVKTDVTVEDVTCRVSSQVTRQQLITVGLDLLGEPDIALPAGRHEILEQKTAKRALDPCGERPYPVGQRTVRRRRYRAHPFFRQDGYMDPFRRGFKRRFSGST
ncbi:hypothetical protein [Rhizobium laguerreae]|uniref:hypothetical protein n=1 Tax=Rhizobium laguerreae TaxID=1076926 RepID=UPI001A8C2BCA|nr:hypothetical protein [Rhizobium laguerreae]MBN9983069.1 hypothetical protein [Rhizobium laguerreae]